MSALFAPGAVVDYVGGTRPYRDRGPYTVVDPKADSGQFVRTDRRISTRNLVIAENGFRAWFLPEELRLHEQAEETFTVTRADLVQIREGLVNHEARTEAERLVSDLLEPPVTRTFLVEMVVPPGLTVTTDGLEQRLHAMNGDVRSVRVEEQR